MSNAVRSLMSAIMISTLLVTASFADDTKPVKVFVLAGQSNMEGKARNTLLDFQGEDAKTKDLFKHLRKDGKWTVRDGVIVKFLDRQGPLTVGFGSPGCTGSELEFGTMLGGHINEPVLLIKAAWGGHSLFQLFRSPSAGLPSEEYLQKELAEAHKRVAANNDKNKKSDPLPTMDDIKKPYGSSYRNMLAEVKTTFDNYETLFPELKGRKLEVAGFFWFQGFNDQFGDLPPAEYQSNMQHFIKDVRKDFGVPNLPFVIAALGTNGSKPAQGGGLAVQNAQMAMERSRVLVLCMTKAAFESEWVRLERNTATFRDPANHVCRFLPLRLSENDCHIPATLRRLKYIDWRAESDTAWQQLLATLQPGAAPRPEISRDEWNPFDPYTSRLGEQLRGPHQRTAAHPSSSTNSSHYEIVASRYTAPDSNWNVAFSWIDGTIP